jgi:predicted nucleotidyltransferase
MKTLAQVTNALSNHKYELSSKFHVEKLAIFGSFARNEQKKESDIDILVEFNAPIGIEFIDLANHLESILKLKVDLVSRNGIKPKYFREIKNDLRYV